jgi:hypothetical protein
MSKRSLTILLLVATLLGTLAFLLRHGFSVREQTLVIATLVRTSGSTVMRDFAAQPFAWMRAPIGARFGLGDGLRTGPDDSAQLKLVDNSALSVMPNTTLRFLTDAQDEQGLNVDLERGEAVVRAGARDLSLRTHVGTAIVKAGSTVTLDREGRELGFSVQLGSLRFRDSDGSTRSVEDGAALRLGLGMAVLDMGSADAGVADAASPDASIEPPDEPELEAPRHFNLSAPAGESFVLHAPEVPVAVAFDFAKKCPVSGEVELIGKRQRARGKGRAALSLAAGVRSYSVRCLGKDGALGRVVAHGTVQVLKDPGTRKLPPKAPTSFVEADGRTYTVYYPNQLPDISVRWPNAPVEASYELEIDGKRETVAAPEHLLTSGMLKDGVHQLSFHGMTRRSRTTTVEVRFDNNAPTASLNEPNDRSFTPGSEVKVAGVALPTWKVSLEGGTIAKLSNGRFEGAIATTSDRPDIVVRLAHPRLGTHYYLRRAASSP